MQDTQNQPSAQGVANGELPKMFIASDGHIWIRDDFDLTVWRNYRADADIFSDTEYKVATSSQALLSYQKTRPTISEETASQKADSSQSEGSKADDDLHEVSIDGFNPDDFRQELPNEEQADDQSEPEQPQRETGMFRIRTANDVLLQAASQPDPIELFSPLVVEGELTMLFADTGIGKTTFGVQMAIEMAATRNVLYVDLELSDKQFEKRFKDKNGQHFRFPDRFFRADFTPQFRSPKGVSYEQYFNESLEQAIEITQAEVVLIDNMTRIAAGDTDTAKATIPIMDNLTRLKLNRSITFVIFEHNKKVDSTRPISLNDLQGSKMKSNFADAVFSIGRSQTDKDLRYIKQLKVRSAELIYDTENVRTYQITTDGGFLHFEPIGYGNEHDFIKVSEGGSKGDVLQERYDRIQEARKKGLQGQGLSDYLSWTKPYISTIEKRWREKYDTSTDS